MKHFVDELGERHYKNLARAAFCLVMPCTDILGNACFFSKYIIQIYACSFKIWIKIEISSYSGSEFISQKTQIYDLKFSIHNPAHE